MKLTKLLASVAIALGLAVASCSTDERVASYERYDCQIGGQWYVCAREW